MVLFQHLFRASLAMVAFFSHVCWAGTKCTPYVPIYGGNVCGPSNAAGYLGSDKAKFTWYKEWNGIPYDGGSKTANFKSACSNHDTCYENIDGGGSMQACLNQFNECNSQFYDEMEETCDNLNKSCQRNQCRTYFRDIYYGLVVAGVPYYASKNSYNCS